METTKCPKRVEEGGIVGTCDLGKCLCTCAAFKSNLKMETCFDSYTQTEIQYYQGQCDEYKRGVVARVRR